MSANTLKTCSRLKHRFVRIRRLYSTQSKDTSCSNSCESSNDTGCSCSSDGSDSGDQAPRASTYDERKYSHGLPGNEIKPPFDIPKMPTGIFRCTYDEVLGPQAGKCAYYRNPEYFSFHHMSFFDMHMILLPYRKPQLKTGRKPTII